MMPTGDNYSPTPDEIAAECAAIRSEWDSDEWARRTAIKNPSVVSPGTAREREPESQDERMRNRRESLQESSA